MKAFLRMKAYAKDQQINIELFWLNREGGGQEVPFPHPYPASPQASVSPDHLRNLRTNHPSLYN